jgi:hypothetical protein
MKETYLTADQITSAFKISKEKLSLMVKYGFFPKPLELHTGAVLWRDNYGHHRTMMLLFTWV